MKKLLITVGGTAGHIYPALALANQLSNVEILFCGGKLRSNPYFTTSHHPFKEISSATFASKNPITIINNCLSISKGVIQSKSIIKSFSPDLILGFGSFYTFPMLVAAKWMKIPIILHEANSIPGKVNRMMSRYAKMTAIHFPKTATRIKGKTTEVQMPIRHAKTTKIKACCYYGLDPKKPTLLVFGGSQGAQAINQLFSEAVDSLPENIQIIHLTGKTQANYRKKAVIKPFEENMTMAWHAADFAISRAGACTIAEQLEFEVPSLLIPYPFATDKHQDFNADFMENDVGGAVKMLQSELNGQILSSLLKKWIEDDQFLKEKKKKITEYKNRKNLKTLASLVMENL